MEYLALMKPKLDSNLLMFSKNYSAESEFLNSDSPSVVSCIKAQYLNQIKTSTIPKVTDTKHLEEAKNQTRDVRKNPKRKAKTSTIFRDKKFVSGRKRAAEGTSSGEEEDPIEVISEDEFPEEKIDENAEYDDLKEGEEDSEYKP
jgi:Na+-translocating ferredoxin:NAD+ oxidoreductase RnfC subunit